MTQTEHGPTDDAMQRPVEDTPRTSAASRKAAKKHPCAARPRDLLGEGHEMPAGSEVMGTGHPMPAGSDVMGDRLYETETEAESDPRK